MTDLKNYALAPKLEHLSSRSWPISLAAILFAAVVFMGAALWNGSPLFYWDSVDYVHMPFSWHLPVYRTMPYGVFAGLGRVFGTLWALVIVQSLMTAYVLHEAYAVFAPGREAKLLALTAVPLTLLTGLSWFTGQIMPDAFTTPVVLAVAALAFCDREFGAVRRTGLFIFIMLGVTVHTTHLALVGGLVIVLAFARWFFRERWPSIRPKFLMPAAALVCGIATIAGIHWVTVGRPFVTQPSYVLWLGRLVQDGILQRLLDDNCKTGEEYKLCQLSGKLPTTANKFLWDWGGQPAKVFGSWELARPEAKKILAKSIRDYPLLHLKAAAKLTAEQIVEVKTGDGLENKMEWLLGGTIRKYYPGDYAPWKNSREMEKPTGIDFKAINTMHVPIAVIGQLALIALIVVAYRRRRPLVFSLSALALIALLGNAFVCGALSNPNDRYQSRLVWIVFVALAVGMRRPQPSAEVEAARL